MYLLYLLHSSVGKESAWSAEDTSSIPGSGRSPGEGIGYPLQYSWASLLAQLVKSSPAMWETWVRSLGWEDPLEKGKATHSSILAWRIPWTIQSMGSQRVGHDWATFTSSVSSWQSSLGSVACPIRARWTLYWSRVLRSSCPLIVGHAFNQTG